MVKTLTKSVREYKKQSILTPIFMVLEVIFECLIPLFMSRLIDEIEGAGNNLTMRPILMVSNLIGALLWEVMARRAVSDPDRRQAGPVPSCLTTFIGLFLCPPFPGRRRGTERWSRCR